MDRDLFEDLPLYIVLYILSILPALAIMTCKCVCKSWRDLLETPEFVKLHLSNSVLDLNAVNFLMLSKPYKILRLSDELNLKVVFNSALPFSSGVHSSVNGLLFLRRRDDRPLHTFLVNPITRDYIKLPRPENRFSKYIYRMQTYGFGVSRLTRQYKVVRVHIEYSLPPSPSFRIDQFDCQVYTVGTGSWRRIPSGEPISYRSDIAGTFLNGNIHWLASKLEPRCSNSISCLDLETEVFSSFYPPPMHDSPWSSTMCVLHDCLCVCDNLSYYQRPHFEIVIWLMREYRNKSWTKDYVIRIRNLDTHFGHLCPIKVSKKGDILMVWEGSKLLFYSSQTGTVEEARVSGMVKNDFRSPATFTPSFLSLKTFALEDVSSF